VAVAAHPVSTGFIEKQTYHLWNRRRELAREFDAWEVASGPYLFEEVRKSGLPVIANSDMHVPRQLRSWKTVLDCERHPQAILEAIRKQQLSLRFFEAPELSRRPGLPVSGGWIHDYAANARALQLVPGDWASFVGQLGGSSPL
jgi:hypothetical protein